MRVVAVSAKQILFLTVPEASSLAVDAYFPVAVLIAMTLTAKPVRFGKGDDLSRDKTQGVPVVEIVTVQAPALPFGVVKDDVLMHVYEFASLRVWHHVSMAIGTGKDVFGERRRRYRVCFLLVGTAFVLFDLFLDNQGAMTIEKLFDISCRD
jgi:hypothetical protein